eukprot:jgi/Bigna1/70592/fgenesh1_pg.12_\
MCTLLHLRLKARARIRSTKDMLDDDDDGLGGDLFNLGSIKDKDTLRKVFGDMSLRRIYAQQLQYFHLIWVVLSVTGVSDEVQEMLREASFAPTSSDDDYASRSTLCFNKTEDGLRFASSESKRRLKLEPHLRKQQRLGALLTELLLNLASPTTEVMVVKNLLAMRKMLLGLYRFTFKPSSALIAKVRQEVAGAPSIRSVKSLAHHRNDSARLFTRSSGAIDRRNY